MSKKYYIDFFRKPVVNNVEHKYYESPDEWKSLTLDEVVLVIEHFDFEEDVVYCLSEVQGEEDIAEWNSEDFSVITAYVDYIDALKSFTGSQH